MVEVEGREEPRSAVSFHTFRHTCASLLFEQGRNVKQVAEWLGHAEFFDEAVAPLATPAV